MLHGSELLADIGGISRRFAADRRQRQQRRALDPRDIDALKEVGLHLSAIPEDHGGWWQGAQRSVRVQCDALRLLAQGDASIALVASMHPSVLAFWRDPASPGTGAKAWEAQKRDVFGTVIDNGWWGTITSEPGSGGDIGQTRARATATGLPGRYLVSGEKHFGSGSGATTHMLTTARRDDADAPEWFFMDVRSAEADGTPGRALKAAWDGHGLAATNSHAYTFKDFPATRMAWPGSWRDVMNATSGAGIMANVAPFVGIVDAAMRHMREEFGRRDQRPEDLHAFERIEWATAHREAWLLYQAYEGAVTAIERKGRAMHEALLAKMSIAVLAESILTRLCRIAGGGAYARHSPLGFWFEDVRALGYLRPPWSLAYDGLLAFAGPGEPGGMPIPGEAALH
ncbi:MAG: acyl-CoA/acyl-ACP dehydrogenase [Alphaproteobacteria bacterium]|nr:acyl-CoA/acyl-ACP dehydrogenase [Alphaproteobacteria bacterium]